MSRGIQRHAVPGEFEKTWDCLGMRFVHTLGGEIYIEYV